MYKRSHSYNINNDGNVVERLASDRLLARIVVQSSTSYYSFRWLLCFWRTLY